MKKKKRKIEEEKNIQKHIISDEELYKEIIDENMERLATIAEANDRMDMVIETLATNGYVVNNGTISSVGDNGKAAFIPSVIFATDTDAIVDTAGAALVPTINGGIRFAIPSEDGEYTKDLGPADLPCVIGTVEQAEGLYIPLNLNAYYIAKRVMDSLFDNDAEEIKLPKDDNISWQ